MAKAGTKIEKNGKVKKFPCTKQLKCKLTNEELLTAGEALSNSLAEIAALEDEMKSLQQSFKARITEKTAQAEQLRLKIQNKHEYRKVDCEEVFDLNAGTVVLIRLDSGDEEESRKMTYEEKQGKLFEDTDESAE